MLTVSVRLLLKIKKNYKKLREYWSAKTGATLFNLYIIMLLTPLDTPICEKDSRKRKLKLITQKLQSTGQLQTRVPLTLNLVVWFIIPHWNLTVTVTWTTAIKPLFFNFWLVGWFTTKLITSVSLFVLFTAIMKNFSMLYIKW